MPENAAEHEKRHDLRLALAQGNEALFDRVVEHLVFDDAQRPRRVLPRELRIALAVPDPLLFEGGEVAPMLLIDRGCADAQLITRFHHSIAKIRVV